MFWFGTKVIIWHSNFERAIKSYNMQNFAAEATNGYYQENV
jgi:hypothetical protein